MDRVRRRVDAAFAAADRADYLPESERRHAGEDRPLRIGFGQTNSQPKTVRNMLRLLDARLGHRVLDIGSGSGWTCALLAEMVGPSGRVIGVEVVPELAWSAQAALREHAPPWATVQEAEPDVLGLPSEDSFERILVSAEAVSLPAPLVSQLAPGGRMVIPVAGRLTVVERQTDGVVGLRSVGHYAFVPLVWRS